MPLYRETAIVNFVLPSVEPLESAAYQRARIWGLSYHQQAERSGKLFPRAHQRRAMAGVLALPRSAFGGWRGNVIRLDGNDNPLSDDVLRELGLMNSTDGSDDARNDAKNLREGDAADRLGWFFSQITHYGSPLIVWTNCRPRRMNFLKVVEPDPAISFLLLTQKQPDAARTIPNLSISTSSERRVTAAKSCSKLWWRTMSCFRQHFTQVSMAKNRH